MYSNSIELGLVMHPIKKVNKIVSNKEMSQDKN